MLMLKKIFKIIFHVFLIALAVIPVLVVIVYVLFNWPIGEGVGNKAALGVTFSNRYAEDIGLDWKEAFTATLDDLGVRKIRIPVYWDRVEKNEGTYDFSEVDWQLQEAGKRNAEIILTVGQKVPRWPECFVPEWTKDNDAKRKEKLLDFVGATIEQYKNNPAVKYWQVENEPFLTFGICPKLDVTLLDKEIALVREKDPSRKIIVTDSGELSIWYQAAKRADIFGTTMYLDVCSNKIGDCFTYPIGPNFFKIKQWVIRTFANQNNAIVIELQGEPWLQGWTIHKPIEEQLAAMDGERLKENVVFAENSGFSEIYIWGVEWWYWMKVQANHPEIWQTAQGMFKPQLAADKN